MNQFHYLFVLLFISGCAIGVNFGFKLGFARKFKIFLLADALILTVYLIWDFWAISKGSWYFDKNQILGIAIFGKLPIEEFLFFIIVPMMSILTYLALSKLARRKIGIGKIQTSANAKDQDDLL